MEIRLEQVFGALFAQKEVASVPPSVLAEVGRMFRACSTDVSKLYPGAGSLLDALRGAGKRVFLLSNAQRLFTEPEMRRLRLWDRFDKIFISSDHGVKKPDLDYFRLALQAAGVPPRNSPAGSTLPMATAWAGMWGIISAMSMALPKW